jgi:hypothetical protein
MPCPSVSPWYSTKKLKLFVEQIFPVPNFLFLYGNVTSTVKLRISVRGRDRSIDGSKNRRTITGA